MVGWVILNMDLETDFTKEALWLWNIFIYTKECSMIYTVLFKELFLINSWISNRWRSVFTKGNSVDNVPFSQEILLVYLCGNSFSKEIWSTYLYLLTIYLYLVLSRIWMNLSPTAGILSLPVHSSPTTSPVVCSPSLFKRLVILYNILVSNFP